MSCYYFSSLTENFNNKTSFTYQTSLSSRFFRTKDSTLNNLNDSILCHCTSLWWRLFDIKSYIYKPTSRQACKSASLRMIFIRLFLFKRRYKALLLWATVIFQSKGHAFSLNLATSNFFLVAVCYWIDVRQRKRGRLINVYAGGDHRERTVLCFFFCIKGEWVRRLN